MNHSDGILSFIQAATTGVAAAAPVPAVAVSELPAQAVMEEERVMLRTCARAVSTAFLFHAGVHSGVDRFLVSCWCAHAAVPTAFASSCIYMQESQRECGKCSRQSTFNGDCCKGCTAKRTMGSKIFGRWPIDAFKQLNTDQQVAFWQSETSTREAMEASLAKVITDNRISKEEDMHKGKYLPLSVWAADGFDVDIIKANCTDIEEHKLLGTTYRVDIHEVCYGEIYTLVQKDIMTWKSEPRRPKRGREEETEQKSEKKKKNEKKKAESLQAPVILQILPAATVSLQSLRPLSIS